MLKRNACYLKNHQTFSENIALIFVQPYAKSKVSNLKSLHLIIHYILFSQNGSNIENYNDICKKYMMTVSYWGFKHAATFARSDRVRVILQIRLLRIIIYHTFVHNMDDV